MAPTNSNVSLKLVWNKEVISPVEIGILQKTTCPISMGEKMKNTPIHKK